MTRLRNDALVHSLEEDLVLRNEVKVSSGITEFYTLPGLRGLWSMGTFDTSGNVFDMSGNVRTLSFVGAGFYATYLSPISGVARLTRADEAGIDILGTESYVAAAVRGLTWGGWYIPFFTVASDEPLATKWDTTGNQRAYRLHISAGGGTGNIVNASVSSNGTLVTTIASTDEFVDTRWIFVVGRYKPSAELALFVQGQRYKYVNTTAIPASIFNSSAGFQIMAENASANTLRGSSAINFLCTMALSDAQIERLFLKSSALFYPESIGA